MNSELIIKIMADYALVPIVILGAFSLIFYVPKGQRLQAYCRILMAGLTAYLFAKIIGSIYQPLGARPFEILNTTPGAAYLNNPGFPSDHALFITAITLAVWFETKRKQITAILVCLVVIVCVGRVLALVHTPADVIGGVLIASVGAIWYIFGKSKHQ